MKFSALTRAYVSLRDLKNFLVDDELKSPIHVPLRIRLPWVLRGFLGRSYIMYALSWNNHREYLSDIARRRSLRINSSNYRANYQSVLNNKLLFEAVLSPLARVPKVYAFISDGVAHLRDAPKHCNRLLPSDACRRIAAPLVFKPVSGLKGEGVVFVTPEDGRLMVDRSVEEYSTFDERFRGKSDYIMCEFISQSDHAAKLFPYSPNTIRAITMLDPTTGEAFMPCAVQRIGTVRSSPVDNWSRGGLSASIDIESGVLGRAATFPYTGRMIWHDFHPDADTAIAGVTTPDWPAMHDDLLRVAEAVPFLKAVAWDLLQTNDGYVLIEANGTADVNLLQIHRPLLKDERVRRFLRHHRVI